jgi:hypothetical protein
LATTSGLKDCERVWQKTDSTGSSFRDQLFQMKQQALSQLTNGFDSCGHRFMWSAAT